MAVFTVGAIGTCGYAMLLVFFRAMVVGGAVRQPAFGEVTDDPGLTIFLDGWVGCFYGGVAAAGDRTARRPHRAALGARCCCWSSS